MDFQRRRIDEYDKVHSDEYSETPIRVQRSRRYVGTRDGNPVFSVAKIFLRPDTAVGPTDRVMFDGTQMSILSYYPATDINGLPHHVEVEI